VLVSVRPEPFGALLYHFGTRQLSFLKDTTLLAVLQAGRRDLAELSTAECKSVIDTLQRMQVFYVNMGGEPTVRRDFWELVGYATSPRWGEVLHQRHPQPARQLWF